MQRAKHKQWPGETFSTASASPLRRDIEARILSRRRWIWPSVPGIPGGNARFASPPNCTCAKETQRDVAPATRLNSSGQTHSLQDYVDSAPRALVTLPNRSAGMSRSGPGLGFGVINAGCACTASNLSRRCPGGGRTPIYIADHARNLRSSLAQLNGANRCCRCPSLARTNPAVRLYWRKSLSQGTLHDLAHTELGNLFAANANQRQPALTLPGQRPPLPALELPIRVTRSCDASLFPDVS